MAAFIRKSTPLLRAAVPSRQATGVTFPRGELHTHPTCTRTSRANRMGCSDVHCWCYPALQPLGDAHAYDQSSARPSSSKLTPSSFVRVSVDMLGRPDVTAISRGQNPTLGYARQRAQNNAEPPDHLVPAVPFLVSQMGWSTLSPGVQPNSRMPSID